MGRRLKLGIDVDGVLADFVSAFRLEAQTVLGREFPHFSSSWNFSNWNITKAEETKVWDHIEATDNWFYLYLNSLPGVSQNIPWLTNEHEVYFITTRIQTAGLPIQRQTEMYLSDLGVEFPTVIVTRDKGPIAAALQLDAFLDDKFENVARVAECSSKTKPYLMGASYNSSYEIPKRWKVVNCFQEFIEALGGSNESAD